MKKVSAALLLALVALPAVAAASEFRFSENPSVSSQETIADDVYIGGGNVTSAGIIEGDLYAGGGSVLISGNVAHDVVVAGGNITLVAPVGDDVRMAGGNLFLQSRVGDNLLAAGGQLSIGGEGIGGDANLAGGVVRLDAPVAGDLQVAGEEVYLNAVVGGDVVVEAMSLTLGSQAQIAGDLVYKAKTEATLEEGATVAGETVFEERTTEPAPSPAKVGGAITIAMFGVFLAQFVSALLFGLLLHGFGRDLVARVKARPWLELGRGLLSIAAFPVLSILAFFTLVGVPLGILGLLGFVSVLLITWMLVPIVVGSLAYQYFSKGELVVSWKTILLGTVLYTLVGLLPFVGWLAQAVLCLMTIGSLVAFKLQTLQDWRK